jgi:hypothetical protein
MRRGTPRRSEQNQLLDEEIGKIPEQLRLALVLFKVLSEVSKAMEGDKCRESVSIVFPDLLPSVI